jgi:hypothetical protein
MENYDHPERRSIPLQYPIDTPLYLPSTFPVAKLSPIPCLAANLCFLLVILLAVEDPQDSEEEVDHVQVKADGGGDLLLHVVMSHDQLGIDEDIAAEDKGGDDAVDEFDCLAAREERGHEAKDDKNPQRAEKIRHPARKVVLGLASKQRQGDEDAQRQNQCLNHNARLVEGCDDADRICLQEGEAGQEEQVRGVGLALPEGQEHEGDRAEERGPHQPAVGLDPVPVGAGEEGDGGENGGQEELDGQDGVDFPDELHADVQRGFRDGAAELGGMLVRRT